MQRTGRVVILGVFVADTAYRTSRLPRMGETVLGESFVLGPGGKGSNQAVAAARAGAEVAFVTRLGEDPFAAMAMELWSAAGVTPVVRRMPESYTGAACILIEAGSGDNAIVIAPGAAAHLEAGDLEAAAGLIEGAAVFLTQLEQPLAAAVRGLEIAKGAGVTTILNPAPGQDLSDAVLALADFVTPNETETEILTGIVVDSLDAARAAAERLVARGAGGALITLGAQGALLHAKGISDLVPAVTAGPVVETTGAGDAFNGGFAAALAKGADLRTAARFGCAVAGLSVTRAGAAASMPALAEVEALLAQA